MFVDRSDELDALGKEWGRDGFSFVVVYGRRRIGKTELIKEFIRDKPHIYFLAPQDTEQMQREKMLEKTSDFFGERKPDIEGWNGAVKYIGEKLEEEKIVFAIDEFPYIVESDRSVLSYLQEMIDGIKSDSMLILCGSSVSVMESDVMGHKSPLYGRRTGQIDLQPFGFATSFKAIGYPIKDAIRSYSITGGAPMYLLNFDYSKSLKENLKEKVLNRSSFMYEEPEFLLRTELRNPKRYMGILEAIAQGHTKPNRISNATGIDTGPLSNYLKTLRKLRLVKREVPVTAERKKSKRSIYGINDNFFRFWFQFVDPKKSWIEEDPEAVLNEDIMPSLDRYVSKTFEDVCMEAAWKLSREGDFRCKYTKIGRWWYGDAELDLVGLNEEKNEALFGECKWTSSPVGYSEVNKLKETATKVDWKKDRRKETYILFSKSGFEKNLKEGGNIKLLDLTDLEKLFEK